MSTTQDLVTALKAELRSAPASPTPTWPTALGMSESSVKRVFAKADMPLSRIDEMLRVLKMDFAELARKVADAQPLRAPAHRSSRRPPWSPTASCCCSRSAASASGRSRQMTKRLRLQRRRVRQVPRRARPPRHHRAAPAQPLPAEGREGLSLAAARAGDALLPQARRRRLPERRLRRRRRADHAGARPDHAEPGGDASSSGCSASARTSRSSTWPSSKLPDEQRTPYTLLVGMRTWLFAAFRDLKRTPPPRRA